MPQRISPGPPAPPLRPRGGRPPGAALRRTATRPPAPSSPRRAARRCSARSAATAPISRISRCGSRRRCCGWPSAAPDEAFALALTRCAAPIRARHADAVGALLRQVKRQAALIARRPTSPGSGRSTASPARCPNWPTAPSTSPARTCCWRRPSAASCASPGRRTARGRPEGRRQGQRPHRARHGQARRAGAELLLAMWTSCCSTTRRRQYTRSDRGRRAWAMFTRHRARPGAR